MQSLMSWMKACWNNWRNDIAWLVGAMGVFALILGFMACCAMIARVQWLTT